MNEEIEKRLARIYAAVQATYDRDLSKIRATLISTANTQGMSIEFSNDADSPELTNAAHSAISNVAHLVDHIKRWGKPQGINSKTIEDDIAKCHALLVVIDLANNDKHGYPPRDRGKSGRSPMLHRISRSLRLEAGPGPNSSSAFLLAPTGPKFLFGGDGRAMTVINGVIVDGAGQVLGDLDQFLSDAISELEDLVKSYEAKVST